MTDAQIQEQLDAVRAQLASLALTKFDEQDAWLLGNLMRERAVERGFPIAIDIRLGDAPLFSVMLPGATAANFDWARRKRNLALLVGASSWELSLAGKVGFDVLDAMGLDSRDYTPHGGCVPITVAGVAGIVATVTVSGLPQQDDHEFAVECLAALKASQV